MYGGGDWWAVITGATDGAGKGYAERLAGDGLNIVLVSRTPAKLDRVKTEIRSKYGVDVTTVAIDFANDDPNDYMKKLVEAVKDKKIGALINNVGMVYGDKIPTTDPAKVRQILNCNIGSVTYVSLAVLPLMIRQRKGIVVNVSSDSCLASTAEWGYYAGSKAYTLLYTEGIRRELEDHGINVLLSRPGFIDTKMVAGMKTVAMLSVQDYVNNTLADVGRKEISPGDARNGLMQFLLSFSFTKDLMLKYFYAYYEG